VKGNVEVLNATIEEKIVELIVSTDDDERFFSIIIKRKRFFFDQQDRFRPSPHIKKYMKLF